MGQISIGVDSVVLFQGIFENFEDKSSWDGSTYIKHTPDPDELDKRKKEAKLLLGRGGFLCFLLTDPFIERDGARDFRLTDLAKFHLSYDQLYRKDCGRRITHLRTVRDEFKRFVDHFGAASIYFQNYNRSLDYREICKAGDFVTGIILNRSEYFIPALVPDRNESVITEYFTLLVEAIASVHNKLHQVTPQWVAEYRFDEERSLQDERAALTGRVSEIDRRLGQLDRFKASLFYSGTDLVEVVNPILGAALGVKTDATDDLREDIKLLANDGSIIAVAEVKGVNRGVTREQINQTDSHRDRSGFDSTFPGVLIVNPNIKSARSIEEKERAEVAAEQIRHAVSMRVLILRTIDLLHLLRLVLGGKLPQEAARSLVLGNVGCLKVEGDEVKILAGNVPEVSTR